MNDDKCLLEEIDDEEIESGTFEAIKKRHFDSGVEITYPEDPDDPDGDYYITEYPNGRKVRQHVNELNT